MKRYIDRILSSVYPPVCPFCGRVTGDGACGACRKALVYISEPRCMRCGKPIRQETKEYCLDCSRHPHAYERGYSLWVHDRMAQRAIYQFKYHNKRIFARFFGQELFARYGKALQRWQITTIIPIPLSRQKKKMRGYNQAELLAGELARLSGIPMDARSLVRVRDTRPQKLMDVRERRRNLSRAFAWRSQNPPHGNILLGDDIYTTGSTIDSAAEALLAAGASKVYFLTISVGQGY